jgi:Tol biopolymer transport system component
MSIDPAAPNTPTPPPSIPPSGAAPKPVRRRLGKWLLIALGGCLICVAGAVLTVGGVGAYVWITDNAYVKPNASNLNPAWSPDGSRIAFASDRNGNYDIYVMQADGSKVVQLTRDPFANFYLLQSAADSGPAWSPDGKQIAFLSGRDNVMMTYVDLNVYVMNADGSRVVQLYSDPSAQHWLAWSPDGSRFTFVSPELGQDHGDIWVMNADGTHPIRLSQGGSDNTTLAWSPDSGRIAFLSNRGGQPDIYVMDADGSNVTRLTRATGPDANGEPDWSPDGRQIVFAGYRNDNTDIYVMNADGSNERRLTQDMAVDNEPTWSPDGTRIAFVSDRTGNSEIYVMNGDGTNAVALTNK